MAGEELERAGSGEVQGREDVIDMVGVGACEGEFGAFWEVKHRLVCVGRVEGGRVEGGREGGREGRGEGRWASFW